MSRISRPDGLKQGAVVDGVNWGTEESPLSIVLTNQCDFEHDKATFVIVCCLVGAKETLTCSNEYKERIGENNDGNILSKRKSKTIKDLLENYIHNKQISRYYYIDANDEIGTPALLADFQHLQSIPFDEAEKLEIIAQMEHPFTEQMMVHFASYSARIPSPRTDSADAINDILEPYQLASD